MTDTGANAEWEIAWRHIKNLSQSVTVLVAPCNHDQNAAYLPSKPLTEDEASKLEVGSVFDPKIAIYLKLQALLVPVADAIRGVHSDGQAVGVAMRHLKSLGVTASGNDVTAAVRALRAPPNTG